MLDNILENAEKAHKQMDFEKEIVFLKEALSIADDKYDIAFITEKIGSSLYLLDKLDESENNLKRSLEHYHTLSGNEVHQSIGIVNYKLGSIYSSKGDYKEALKYCREAYKYCEDLSANQKFMVLTQTGFNYENLKNYDKAIECYKESQEIPDISLNDKCMLLHMLGRCYDQKGEEQKTFSYYQKLFSINPDYDDSWYIRFRYGELAHDKRKYRIAINFLQNIVNIIPSNEIKHQQIALQCLGNSYLAVKEYEPAITVFKKALKVKSAPSKNKAYILCGLAQSFFETDDINNTISFGLKALKEKSDELIAERLYYLLSYSYFIKNNNKKGKLYFNKLKAVNSGSVYLRELINEWGNLS